MAQILVRNIDDAVKSALQQRAARRGVSMEAEARDILQRALMPTKSQSAGWATRISARFASLDMPEIQNAPGQAIPAELPE
jgi:plasmid stability protein